MGIRDNRTSSPRRVVAPHGLDARSAVHTEVFEPLLSVVASLWRLFFSMDLGV